VGVRRLRSSLILLLLFATRVAAAKDVPVSDLATLAGAIAAAQPGDVIILADGSYDSTGLTCSANGTPAAPITVKAAHPLAATIRFDALEGFKVSGDHWHFEGLSTVGVCVSDDNCEHSYHVNGAVGFQIKGCKAVDFNAQIKVNVGAANKLPNAGLIEGNEFYDSRARNTANPVTKLDLDSGDDWIIRGNFIHDYEKGLGDQVSYAAFLKCGGNRGLMERNLVLCSRDHVGGTRIGLSLGGGGCAPSFCEPAFDAGTPCVEHHDGVVRNNIVASCSDVGIYVNQSPNSHVLYNTLVATTGVDFRFAMTTGEAAGNLLAGMIRNRDGATGTFAGNVEGLMQTDFDAMYVDPLKGDLRKKGSLAAVLGLGPANARVTDDYCARTRPSPFDVGAIQASLGDCASGSVLTDGGIAADLAGVDAAGTMPDAAIPGGGATDSGCSCSLTRRASSPTGALVLLLLASSARARTRRRFRQG
jgi:hypothetical protein